MADYTHHRKLEHLYPVAPISRWYGASIRISDGEASVSIYIRPDFYHAANEVSPQSIVYCHTYLVVRFSRFYRDTKKTVIILAQEFPLAVYY